MKKERQQKQLTGKTTHKGPEKRNLPAKCSENDRRNDTGAQESADTQLMDRRQQKQHTYTQTTGEMMDGCTKVLRNDLSHKIREKQ